mgnify:CR=1 FL=1
MPRTLRHTSKRSPLVFGLLAVLLVAALSVPAGAAQGTTVIRAGEAALSSPASGAAQERLLAAGTQYATPYYDNDSGVPGPVVIVVGGMHGNEPAGYMAARRLAGVRPQKGRLIVIPEANKLAIEAKTRTGSHPGDLNRAFPTSRSDKPGSPLAASIWSLVERVRPDYLFDLHEGYDFHKINKDSVGQSIIYYPVQGASEMAKAMQTAVNRGISNSKHHYSVLRYPVKGSLARAAGQLLGARAMILETSRKQPLETRVDQHVTMVKAALARIGML